MASYKYEFYRRLRDNQQPTHKHYIFSYDNTNPEYESIDGAYNIPNMDGMFGDNRIYRSLSSHVTGLQFTTISEVATNFKPNAHPVTRLKNTYSHYKTDDAWQGFASTDRYDSVFPDSAEPTKHPKTGYHGKRGSIEWTLGLPVPVFSVALETNLKFWKDLNIRSSSFGQNTSKGTYANDKHPLRMIYDNQLKSGRFANASNPPNALISINKRNSLSSKHISPYYIQSFNIVKFLGPMGEGTVPNYPLNWLIKTQNGLIMDVRTGYNVSKSKIHIYSPYRGNNSLIDFVQTNYFIDFYVRTDYNVDYTQYFSATPYLPYYYNTW
jgi:hypothetical protein